MTTPAVRFIILLAFIAGALTSSNTTEARGSRINLQRKCIDICDQINNKCKQREMNKAWCDNIIYNNCAPSCGGLCTSAERNSLQVQQHATCYLRYGNCRDASIDYCAKQYYWCVNAISSLSCMS